MEHYLRLLCATEISTTLIVSNSSYEQHNQFLEEIMYAGRIFELPDVRSNIIR